MIISHLYFPPFNTGICNRLITKAVKREHKKGEMSLSDSFLSYRNALAAILRAAHSMPGCRRNLRPFY
jgi:hypothetical protein